MSHTVPDTLCVHIPFRLRKHGGRKLMILPESAPAKVTRIDNTVVKALARAFRWKKMMESGAFATIGDLATHEKMPPSYLTRVLRLTLLAPEIIEAILDSQSKFTATLPMLMEPFPKDWEEQMACFR